MINLSGLHPGLIRYPKSVKCDRPGECSPGKGLVAKETVVLHWWDVKHKILDLWLVYGGQFTLSSQLINPKFCVCSPGKGWFCDNIDWRFDNLSRSHHQSQVDCESSVADIKSALLTWVVDKVKILLVLCQLSHDVLCCILYTGLWYQQDINWQAGRNECWVTESCTQCNKGRGMMLIDDRPADWLTDGLMNELTYWLTSWLSVWVTDLLTGRQIDKLTDCLNGRLAGFLSD